MELKSKQELDCMFVAELQEYIDEVAREAKGKHSRVLVNALFDAVSRLDTRKRFGDYYPVAIAETA
ncbi:MAG: hypothetical protein V1847_00110 [Candidatus Diapherotrites archaeon]